MDSPAPGLSIFDLDRTLTRRPTYSAFLLGAALRVAPWRLALAPAVLPWWIAHKAGRVTRKRLKEAMHQLMLGGRLPRAKHARLMRSFVDRVAEAGVYGQAKALIAAEKSAGRRLVLATAAPAHYAEALGEALGFDQVIASGAAWEDDRLLSTIAGENCWGADKHRMIVAALGQKAGRRARFFSDDHSDLPTFEWVAEPTAVNPTARLRRIAKERGWPILDWRKDGSG